MAGVSSPPWPWEKREAARRPCPLGVPRRCLDKSRAPAAPLWVPWSRCPMEVTACPPGLHLPRVPSCPELQAEAIEGPWVEVLSSDPSVRHTVHGLGHTWAQEEMGDLNMEAKQGAGAGLLQWVPELCPAGHTVGPEARRGLGQWSWAWGTSGYLGGDSPSLLGAGSGLSTSCTCRARRACVCMCVCVRERTCAYMRACVQAPSCTRAQRWGWGGESCALGRGGPFLFRQGLFCAEDGVGPLASSPL